MRFKPPVLLLAPALTVASAAAADAPDAAEAGSMIRMTEEPGRRVGLQVATRRFTDPAGGMPDVGLVGVAHVGEPGFYRQVQALLEGYSVVLYESVGPPGVGGAGGDSPKERVGSTSRALRFLAAAAVAHRQLEQAAPADLEALGRFAAGLDPRLGHWVAAARRDGWGRPVGYQRSPDGDDFVLVSLGADGLPGGDGPAADLQASAADAGMELLSEQDNLQAELAAALSLAFQLQAIDYGRPNFRPSDMDLSQLEEALAARGVDAAPLGSLAGSSLPGKLVVALLRMTGAIDRLLGGAIADAFKVVLIEMLSDDAVMEQGLQMFGPGFGEVLIGDRNQVVMDDLQELSAAGGVESVAILYGAGHMPDFARRLAAMGYELVGDETWLTVFEVDLRRSMLSESYVNRIRAVVRQGLRDMGTAGQTD